jgi:hypothetical protein
VAALKDRGILEGEQVDIDKELEVAKKDEINIVKYLNKQYGTDY